MHRIILWPLGGFVELGQTKGMDVMGMTGEKKRISCLVHLQHLPHSKILIPYHCSLFIAEDFWVAFAGPLTHIPMIGIWFALWWFTRDPSLPFKAFSTYEISMTSTAGLWVAELSEGAITLNAALFLFNLLVPAYPLDGGRILAALLVKCGTPVRSAARITSVSAMCIGGLMIAYGLYGFIDDGFNGGGSSAFTLLIGAWIIFCSLGLYRLVREDRVHEHPMFNKPCYLRDVERQNPVHDNINIGVQNETAETSQEKRSGSRFSSFFGKKEKEEDPENFA